MDKSSGTQDEAVKNFDSLLDWLDQDRRRAGEKYEALREQLTKIFSWRGCSEPEGLVDETIDRVVRRLPEIAGNYKGDPGGYFYGVAKNVLREYGRRAEAFKVVQPAERHAIIPYVDQDETRELECLDKCLLMLSPQDRELVLQYYQTSKPEKLNARKALGDQLGISLRALRLRVYRIRISLRECIETCMKDERTLEK